MEETDSMIVNGYDIRTRLWETLLLPVFMSLLPDALPDKFFLGTTLMISRSSEYAATELFAGVATTGLWFQQRSLASKSVLKN